MKLLEYIPYFRKKRLLTELENQCENEVDKLNSQMNKLDHNSDFDQYLNLLKTRGDVRINAMLRANEIKKGINIY